jgi:hypothetical protein
MPFPLLNAPKSSWYSVLSFTGVSVAVSPKAPTLDTAIAPAATAYTIKIFMDFVPLPNAMSRADTTLASLPTPHNEST